MSELPQPELDNTVHLEELRERYKDPVKRDGKPNMFIGEKPTISFIDKLMRLRSNAYAQEYKVPESASLIADSVEANLQEQARPKYEIASSLAKDLVITLSDIPEFVHAAEKSKRRVSGNIEKVFFYKNSNWYAVELLKSNESTSSEEIVMFKIARKKIAGEFDEMQERMKASYRSDSYWDEHVEIYTTPSRNEGTIAYASKIMHEDNKGYTFHPLPPNSPESIEKVRTFAGNLKSLTQKRTNS